MRDPAFWWREASLAAKLLRPLGWIYGKIAANRMRRRGAHPGIPVICVGNFTLGGAGKTPTALAIAHLLTEGGANPFFLSRGYGGRLAGPTRVDPHLHSASDVGDEPLLLARRAPTIVSRDRVAGAMLARQSGANVIIMDDGLQNPSLQKSLTIAVVDAARGLGNGCVFPAGPLRAPLDTQLDYTNAVLTVASGKGDGLTLPQIHNPDIAHLRARLAPDETALEALRKQPVLAFAGIGNPEKFFATLTVSGVQVAESVSFPDHHPFTAADASRLLARSAEKELTLVTTEKDRVRLEHSDAGESLAASVRSLPVELIFEDEEKIRDLLRQALTARA